MYFPDSGCIRTLRTLCVYATECKHSLGVAYYNCVCAIVRYRLVLNLVNLKHFCNNKECVRFCTDIMKFSDRQPKISDSLKISDFSNSLGQHPPSTPSNTPMSGSSLSGTELQ